MLSFFFSFFISCAIMHFLIKQSYGWTFQIIEKFFVYFFSHSGLPYTYVSECNSVFKFLASRINKYFEEENDNQQYRKP